MYLRSCEKNAPWFCKVALLHLVCRKTLFVLQYSQYLQLKWPLLELFDSSKGYHVLRHWQQLRCFAARESDSLSSAVAAFHPCWFMIIMIFGDYHIIFLYILSIWVKPYFVAFFGGNHPFINHLDHLCCSHWGSGFEAIGNAYPSFQSPRKYLSPGLFGPCGALEPLERGTLEGLSSRNFDLKWFDAIHWNS